MAKAQKKEHTGGGRTAKPPQSAHDRRAAAPDRERIAKRAYELYLARGASDGDALDDWLTAERELAVSGTDRTPE
jgi:hypothetical protein